MCSWMRAFWKCFYIFSGPWSASWRVDFLHFCLSFSPFLLANQRRGPPIGLGALNPSNFPSSLVSEVEWKGENVHLSAIFDILSEVMEFIVLWFSENLSKYCTCLSSIEGSERGKVAFNTRGPIFKDIWRSPWFIQLLKTKRSSCVVVDERTFICPWLKADRYSIVSSMNEGHNLV